MAKGGTAQQKRTANIVTTRGVNRQATRPSEFRGAMAPAMCWMSLIRHIHNTRKPFRMMSRSRTKRDRLLQGHLGGVIASHGAAPPIITTLKRDSPVYIAQAAAEP